MQEAYRPLRSEYSLCCPNHGGTHPRSRSRSRFRGGTPSLARWRVPCPGVPPIQVWMGDTPSLAGGTPGWSIPPSGPGWGTPHLDLAEYPLIWTWIWLESPPSGPDWGTPLCGQTDGWMDRHMSKHYLLVILCTRVVINHISFLTYEI